MKETFKDHTAEKIFDMGIEDHKGNVYGSLEVFENLDEMLDLLDKSELIEIIKDWNNKE